MSMMQRCALKAFHITVSEQINHRACNGLHNPYPITVSALMIAHTTRAIDWFHGSVIWHNGYHLVPSTGIILHTAICYVGAGVSRSFSK